MEWALFASRECDGWQGALRATGGTDEVLADALEATAAECDDGTLLRIISDDPRLRGCRVVVAGKAREFTLAPGIRGYLGESARTAWDMDPGRWWVESTDARCLLRVASSVVTPTASGTSLHHAVIHAACACVRDLVQDALLNQAIQAVEQWCAGTAALEDAWVVARNAFALSNDRRRPHTTRMLAQVATNLASAVTVPWGAVRAVALALEIAPFAGSPSSKGLLAVDNVRAHVDFTPVLVALVSGE